MKKSPTTKPVTVGQHLDSGYRLVEIWCNDCNHSASFDVSNLPRDRAIVAIAQKAVCTKCGSRNCMSRGDITEFYTVERERSGYGRGM